MNTPRMLVRTAIYAAAAQLLGILLIAGVVPGGASKLVTAGFVTPFYDTNIFAVRIVGLPGTDPVVYLSAQSVVQVLAISLGISAVVTLARTNPWRPDVVPSPQPPAKPKPAGRGSDTPAPPASSDATPPTPSTPRPPRPPAAPPPS